MLSIMANRSDKRGRRKITALDSSGYQKQFNQKKKLTSEFEKKFTEKTSRIGKKGLILDLVPNCLAQFDQQCNDEKIFFISFQAPFSCLSQVLQFLVKRLRVSNQDISLT